MASAALVLACALDLLGRSAHTLPTIRILDAPPRPVSTNANAFVDRSEGIIYLIASAPAFQMARGGDARPGHCRPVDVYRFIASMIVHEEWHLRHGASEKEAYLAQLITLQRLGSGPGSWPYASVVRAMQAVERAQRSPLLPDAALARAR